MLSFGNNVARQDVVSKFWLLSHFHCRLVWSAALNGSDSCDILTAGAFVYINPTSTGKWLAALSEYLKGIFLPLFSWNPSCGSSNLRFFEGYTVLW